MSQPIAGAITAITLAGCGGSTALGLAVVVVEFAIR